MSDPADSELSSTPSTKDYEIIIGNKLVGVTALSPESTLADARIEIAEDDIPGVPEDFFFLLPSGASLSKKQEHKRYLSKYLTDGKIVLRAVEKENFAIFVGGEKVGVIMLQASLTLARTRECIRNEGIHQIPKPFHFVVDGARISSTQEKKRLLRDSSEEGNIILEKTEYSTILKDFLSGLCFS